MPTAKPRYIKIQDLEFGLVSDALRLKLQEYCPAVHAAEKLPWGSASDEFARRLVAEAHGTLTRLKWHSVDLTKQEIRATQLDLMKRLEELSDDLRALPVELNRLLPPDVHPEICADEAEKLHRHLQTIGNAIDSLPTGKRIVERQSDVAVELTVRVLDVLNMYGITASATANTSLESCSLAAKVLKSIGDAIGLHKDLVTWRGNITRAKKLSPDLK